jgi:hypothetical protein
MVVVVLQAPNVLPAAAVQAVLDQIVISVRLVLVVLAQCRALLVVQ